MTRDHLAEIALIETSRQQRKALERWFAVLITAGISCAEAKAIVAALASDEMREAA